MAKALRNNQTHQRLKESDDVISSKRNNSTMGMRVYNDKDRNDLFTQTMRPENWEAHPPNDRDHYLSSPVNRFMDRRNTFS